MTNEELLSGLSAVIERNRELEESMERVKQQLALYSKAIYPDRYFENEKIGQKGTALNQTIGLHKACERISFELSVAIEGGESWAKYGPFSPEDWKKYV